jgi:Flp pilus assembly pilin Flp
MDTSRKASPRRVVQAGQGLVEYALILSLIASLAIGGALFLGGATKSALSKAGSSVGGAVAGEAATPAPVEGGPCGNGGEWELKHGTWVCEGESPTPRPTPAKPSSGCSAPKQWVFNSKPDKWKWDCKKP